MDSYAFPGLRGLALRALNTMTSEHAFRQTVHQTYV